MKTKFKITIVTMVMLMLTLITVVIFSRGTKEPLADTHEPVINLALTDSVGMHSPITVDETFTTTEETIEVIGMTSLYEVEVIETPVEMDVNVEPEVYDEVVSETTEVVMAPEDTSDLPVGQRSLGYFTITAYCACSQCCGVYAENRGDVVTGALGVELIPNYSIAVDPNVIGFYDVVYINGQPYEAHDTGGAVKGNRIDIYMGDHQSAINWGVRTIEVFY